MNLSEFSNQFDILYNNITSNQAPGLSEYEKSVFLTKAQDEVIKNYFNPKGNKYQEGFDDSAKRQIDFLALMQVTTCSPVIYYKFVYTVYDKDITEYFSSQDITFYRTITDEEGKTKKQEVTWNITKEYAVEGDIVRDINNEDIEVEGLPYSEGILNTVYGKSVAAIDNRSISYIYPSDIFISVNEVIRTTTERQLQVVPLRFDEYSRLMQKPYKRPLKNQAWKLVNSGGMLGNSHLNTVEIITRAGDTISEYIVRYIRRPKPIILTNIADEGLTINGIGEASDCELNPIIHDEILQRAVELAKVAWGASGSEGTEAFISAGQRSE